MVLKSINPFKKSRGKAVEINFSGGFFSDNVKGVIRKTSRNFVIIDYAHPGNEIQHININKIRDFSFLDKEEKQSLIDFYKK